MNNEQHISDSQRPGGVVVIPPRVISLTEIYYHARMAATARGVDARTCEMAFKWGADFAIVRLGGKKIN